MLFSKHNGSLLKQQPSAKLQHYRGVGSVAAVCTQGVTGTLMHHCITASLNGFKTVVFWT